MPANVLVSLRVRLPSALLAPATDKAMDPGWEMMLEWQLPKATG